MWLYIFPRTTIFNSHIFQVTPWAMRDILKWVNRNYGKYPIIITENGVSDVNRTSSEDDLRISFIKVSKLI